MFTTFSHRVFNRQLLSVIGQRVVTDKTIIEQSQANELIRSLSQVLDDSRPIIQKVAIV
jgi:hypothetical protein